ncbi:MAG: squalene/phytoene synthase family protein [Ktedonobacterales bacterium]
MLLGTGEVSFSRREERRAGVPSAQDTRDGSHSALVASAAPLLALPVEGARLMTPVQWEQCDLHSPAIQMPAIRTPTLQPHSTTASALAHELDERTARDVCAVPLDTDFRHCQRIMQQIARTFYYGSLFLPAEKRRAAWALYAFCRVADDIADERDLYPDPLADLARWRTALLDAFAGRPRGPVMRALADVVRRYNVPLQPALDLLDGVEMDARNAAFTSFADLRLYCYRVAGTVGLLMAPVLGYQSEEALSLAVDLGIAQQLTNILRDIGEDLSRGRVYLPSEELAAFGYCRAELEQGIVNDAFIKLIEFNIERAEQYYSHGMQGVRLLDADTRLAITLSADLYRAILHRIRANHYDVFTQRAHIPLPRKLAMLPGAWRRAHAM